MEVRDKNTWKSKFVLSVGRRGKGEQRLKSWHLGPRGRILNMLELLKDMGEYVMLLIKSNADKIDKIKHWIDMLCIV